MSKKIDTLKILIVFMNEPNKEFHIREVAKITKLAPTTVASYLNAFKNEGLLERKKERGFILYKANSENPLYRDTKLYQNIKMIRESGLIDFLIQEFNH